MLSAPAADAAGTALASTRPGAAKRRRWSAPAGPAPGRAKYAPVALAKLWRKRRSSIPSGPTPSRCGATSTSSHETRAAPVASNASAATVPSVSSSST
jgi:hypothetical protein